MNKYQNVAPVAPANMNMAQRQMAVSQAMRPNMMHLQAVGQAAPAAPAEPKKIQPIKTIKECAGCFKENWSKLLPFVLVAAVVFGQNNDAPKQAPVVLKKSAWGKK